MPILLLAEESDRVRVMRGLDLGVNDFIMRPIEAKRAQRARAQPGPAPPLCSGGCAIR